MQIERIASPEASRIIERTHYLGPLEYAVQFCLTTPERDAVATYAAPMAAHFKRALPGSLELTRLWQANAQKRPLSRFLAATLRWLRANAPECPAVFSYADPGQANPITGDAHSGGIYRAANFAELGHSKTRKRGSVPPLRGDASLARS
jgi:hypothetical protein